MKKQIKILTAIIIIFLSSVSYLQAAEPVKPVKNKYFELDNGLQVFLEVRDKIPMINIGFAVDVGSKNENEETSGLVHLLEHLILLGGGKSYPTARLMKEIRNRGLYFNAHTGHDMMTLDISAPKAQTDFALQLVFEKAFNLELNDGELQKEKKVILEELAQIGDDPAKLGISLTFQSLFSDHPYEKPVSGTKEIIENADIATLQTFQKKYFFPSNCALAVVGDLDIEDAAKKIKKIFGKLENPEISLPKLNIVPPLKKIIKIERELDVTQGHLFIGYIAPDSNHKDKLAMDVITRILGRGVSPMLINALRGGRLRLVDRASMSYYNLKYGGAVLIHMILEPKNINRARKELFKFLRRANSLNYTINDFLPANRRFATDYLETAKNGMQLSSRQFMEQGLNLALSYARYMLFNETNYKKSYKERIAEISSSKLRKTVLNYFSGKKYVSVAITPQKNKEKSKGKNKGKNKEKK